MQKEAQPQRPEAKKHVLYLRVMKAKVTKQSERGHGTDRFLQTRPSS
jgi:hypothetical protein